MSLREPLTGRGFPVSQRAELHAVCLLLAHGDGRDCFSTREHGCDAGIDTFDSNRANPRVS